MKKWFIIILLLLLSRTSYEQIVTLRELHNKAILDTVKFRLIFKDLNLSWDFARQDLYTTKDSLLLSSRGQTALYELYQNRYIILSIFDSAKINRHSSLGLSLYPRNQVLILDLKQPFQVYKTDIKGSFIQSLVRIDIASRYIEFKESSDRAKSKRFLLEPAAL